MKILITLILITLILITFNKFKFNKSKLNSTIPKSCPVIKKMDSLILNDIINDIGIKPIGCYTNIKDMSFTSCINPYSKNKQFDSGITLTNYPSDILNLINIVINNGYDLYGNDILNKYSKTDYSNLNIIEIATLGYLAGYRFMSICKEYNEKNEIFFSYSQPKSGNDDLKPDLPYTITPPLNKYTNEMENAVDKQLSCGYPCLQNGNPQIDNKGNQYMCGSQIFPNIKTPPRYSVYQIFEKT